MYHAKSVSHLRRLSSCSTKGLRFGFKLPPCHKRRSDDWSAEQRPVKTYLKVLSKTAAVDDLRIRKSERNPGRLHYYLLYHAGIVETRYQRFSIHPSKNICRGKLDKDLFMDDGPGTLKTQTEVRMYNSQPCQHHPGHIACRGYRQTRRKQFSAVNQVPLLGLSRFRLHNAEAPFHMGMKTEWKLNV